jgi:hypothetical protein
MPSLPFVFECGFDSNSISPFNSETDVDGKGNIRHYSYLAKQLSFSHAVPYKGAYAYHIDLSGGVNDCYLEELEGFDTAATGTIALRLYFFAAGLVMATSDRFTIATLQSGAGTDEATVSVLNNAGQLQLVFAETGAIALGAATRTSDLIQNAWHCLELVCVIDAGGGNDGTLTAFVDGYQLGAAITGLDQGAITQARIGALGIDAGTTAGHLLFDAIVGDTARVGPLAVRFSDQRTLTQTGHIILGAASIVEVDLIQSSVVDETMELWDTDSADTTDLSKRIFVYNAIRPIYVTKGLYCVLAGTNPIGVVKVCEAKDMSEGMLRTLGHDWRP